MKKIWSITKWEFLERVKNRLLIITLIVAPLLVLTVGAAAGMLSQSNLDYTKVIGISTENQSYFSSITSELEKLTTKENQPAYIVIRLNDKGEVANMMLDGQIEIAAEENAVNVTMFSKLSLSPIDIADIEKATELGIFKSSIQSGSGNVYLPVINITKEQKLAQETVQEDNFKEFFFSSFAFLFLFIVVVIFSGSNFVRALIEEKSTHINEILLSSTSSTEVLFGKYFGLLLIGLLQTIFWFGISYVFFSEGSFTLAATPNYLLLLIYFLLGYFLYTSIFLAFGAQISSENESQQITTLVSLFLLIPIILAGQVLVSPNSLLSTIFTYLPFTTAPLMLIKLNITDISLSEILITIALQLLTIFIVIKIASKYFARGLAQFDKRKRK